VKEEVYRAAVQKERGEGPVGGSVDAGQGDTSTTTRSLMEEATANSKKGWAGNRKGTIIRRGRTSRLFLQGKKKKRERMHFREESPLCRGKGEKSP